MGTKGWGKHMTTDQVIARMKNYITIPIALPFLTCIPEEKTWEVLWVSILMHKVHPPYGAITEYHVVWSLVTYPETNKV